jgi:hypothetical protein
MKGGSASGDAEGMMPNKHRRPECIGVRGPGHGPRLHQRRRRAVVAAAERGEMGSERVMDPPGPVAGHGRSQWPAHSRSGRAAAAAADNNNRTALVQGRQRGTRPWTFAMSPPPSPTPTPTPPASPAMRCAGHARIAGGRRCRRGRRRCGDTPAAGRVLRAPQRAGYCASALRHRRPRAGGRRGPRSAGSAPQVCARAG